MLNEIPDDVFPRVNMVTHTPQPKKETKMDNTQNGTNSGWGAGVGGLIGAAIGNGGSGGGLFGGNREQSVTPDQLGTAINGLRDQINTDAIESQIGRVQHEIGSTSAHSTLALGAGIASVKDAVVNSSAQNQLALCGLGHSVQSGFAGVTNTILMQGAASRELALQQALDAERVRATELRIALSEHKNQAGHASTQVLLNQVIAAKGV